MCGDNRLVETLKCPRCNSEMLLEGANYVCLNNLCKFYVPRIIRRKVITKKILEKLFNDKETDFIEGFYKKGLNETFSALLKLNDDWKISIHLDKPSNKICPLCGDPLYQFLKGYECKNSKCLITKLWRSFRGKNISDEQFNKLLKNRKTDLIKGFVSNKTLKRYNAFIIINDHGNMDVEFEELESDL